MKKLIFIILCLTCSCAQPEPQPATTSPEIEKRTYPALPDLHVPSDTINTEKQI